MAPSFDRPVVSMRRKPVLFVRAMGRVALLLCLLALAGTALAGRKSDALDRMQYA